VSSTKSIRIFSKTNGFSHKEAIIAWEKVFKETAAVNDWFIYQTDRAGIFNVEQFAKFDAVVWTNVSGKVLTDKQLMDF
jgi:isocitrate/isopropylmalate dehydrogenase